MSRYLPIAFGVLVIVSLTYIQFLMTDRVSGSNVTAAQRKALLDNVPKTIGDWQSDDIPIDEGVRQTAGAEGAIQRKYRNSRTGEEVDLWLIVGHGRVVARHTPDVCYRSSGFTARSAENSLYPMQREDGTEVPFFTNTFFREDATGRQLIRVFWTWYNAGNKNHEGKVVWETPANPTWHFGNTRALFKMYFTSPMRDTMETAEKSPCLNFAREFLPVVDQALTTVSNPGATSVAKAVGSEAKGVEEPSVATAGEEIPAEINSGESASTAEESVDTPELAPATEEVPSSK